MRQPEWLLRQWGVTLPELPVGEPVFSDEQKSRIARLVTEVADIRQRIAASEQELSTRQAAWERQLREQAAALPESPSEGLVAHYPFDETEGTTAVNAVKGQPGGVYTGPGQPEWVPGVMGNAVSLDGKGGRFSCGQAFNPERTDALSYGCWFLAAEKSTRGVLLSKFVGIKGFALNIDAARNGVICEWHHHWPDNALMVNGSVPALVDRWNHLFVTYDGSSSATGVKIYVNGRLVLMRVELDTLSESIQTSTPLEIGSRAGGFPFQGAIDDVRIYNRRLGEAEISQLYSSVLAALVGVPSESRNPAQQAFLAATYRSQDEPLQRLNSQLAAAETALRDARRWEGVRRWYVNGQGQTMVVIPGPVEFTMGMPTTEVEIQEYVQQHLRRIGRTFAIASKPVTVEQYRQFEKEYYLPEAFAQMADLPVTFVNWGQGANYCNWLSEQEGLPADQWCYEVSGLKAGYLSLSGYRLPTEAEMEYATRAGTLTSRYFGETDELLSKYAWYDKNSQETIWPVGHLKPNDFGLFDVQGNVNTWCQESYHSYVQAVEVVEDKEDVYLEIRSSIPRVLRGGSFIDRAALLRSAGRQNSFKVYRNSNYGFRVARTLPLVPLIP